MRTYDAAVKSGTRVQAVPVIHVGREREEREILPVHVVFEIEHLRKSGAGDLRLVP